jgi:hypothetical protein
LLTGRIHRFIVFGFITLGGRTMRLNRTLIIVLTLAAFTLALASAPAAAAGRLGCQKIYATLDTTVVEEYVEIGEVEGTINGAAYLRYDDAAPAIDPKTDSPNFVITSKVGDLNLWVYNEKGLQGGDSWWRYFMVLRAEGTGVYAKQAIDLQIYGKCSATEGSYEIQGVICPAKRPKAPKR